MTSWIWIVLLILAFMFIWEAIFIWMWVKGVRERNSTLTIIGGVFSLGIIGLVISLVQVSGWNNETYNHHNIDIEKDKLALEREKLELEKQKHEENKNKKS